MLEVNRTAGFGRAKLCGSEAPAMRIPCRRTTPLGLWAVDRLGMLEHRAVAYTGAIVGRRIRLGGDDAVVARSRQGPDEAEIHVRDGDIPREVARRSTLASPKHGTVPPEPKTTAAA